MTAAMVDTAVLVGMADADDQHHEEASRIVGGIDRGELPTGRVTNYVVLETLNWIHSRQQPQTAREVYDRLNESAGFELVHAAQKDFTRGIELFETYDGFSFGDATIVAAMQREGIEHLYSFDDDFDAVDGLTRLDTASDPFD